MHSAVMSAGIKDNQQTHLPAAWSQASLPPLKFFRLAHLRKLRRCEKVAAVCYRAAGRDIEFLLVQTRNRRRWTFPKGSAEPGLTHAQAAALEAFEEAGVHGRMEEACFTRYFCEKRGDQRNSSARPPRELAVNAHLCEVSRLGPPQELDRHPTWFSAEKAKRRLRQNRPADSGNELARVVDRAVTRIRRLRETTRPAIEGQIAEPALHGFGRDARRLNPPRKDALQKVRFIDEARRIANKPAGYGKNIVASRT